MPTRPLWRWPMSHRNRESGDAWPMLLQMTDYAYPFELNVSHIGYMARSLIEDGGWTRTGAVFANCFYIETPGAWVCVTGSSVAMGPLALRCDLPGRMDWRSCGVRAGMAAFAGPTAICLPPLFRLPLSEASTWTPAAVPHWAPKSLRCGLRYLVGWMNEHRHTNEGLIHFIQPESHEKPLSAAAVRAHGHVVHFRRWLLAVVADNGDAKNFPFSAIDGLFGLGPGLTPSGDDFLGGAIIGLQLIGRLTAAAQLFDAIRAKPANCSNPISRSHLAASANGSCNEWIHATLNAILACDTESLLSNLDRIGQIGHTSGWDTLAGAVTVFRVQAECNHPDS